MKIHLLINSLIIILNIKISTIMIKIGNYIIYIIININDKEGKNKK